MIVIEGKIKGKARPRIYNGHAFTPKDTVNYENWVKLCYQQQGGKLLQGSIRANIIAYYKIPKSYSKKRVQAIREGKEYPQKKPDSDNIIKIILDALNGICYHDDSQVCKIYFEKKYSEIPKVEITIKEIVL